MDSRAGSMHLFEKNRYSQSTRVVYPCDKCCAIGIRGEGYPKEL